MTRWRKVPFPGYIAEKRWFLTKVNEFVGGLRTTNVQDLAGYCLTAELKSRHISH